MRGGWIAELRNVDPLAARDLYGAMWRRRTGPDAESVPMFSRRSIAVVEPGPPWRNLADAQPPIVLSGTAAVDLANANPFGRIMTFEVSKRF